MGPLQGHGWIRKISDAHYSGLTFCAAEAPGLPLGTSPRELSQETQQSEGLEQPDQRINLSEAQATAENLTARKYHFSLWRSQAENTATGCWRRWAVLQHQHPSGTQHSEMEVWALLFPGGEIEEAQRQGLKGTEEKAKAANQKPLLRKTMPTNGCSFQAAW